MTVPTESGRSGPFAGNGVQVIFVVTFEFEDETHLQVIQTVSATGVETIKVLTTDYTVSGSNVTMVVAPPSGETLLIIRKVPFTQESDYTNTGGADQEVVETDFDLAVMRILQVDELQKRQLRVPASSTLSEAQLEVPDPALSANRGLIVATKGDGTGIELIQNVDVGQITAAIGAGDAGKIVIVNGTENGISSADDGTDISENLIFSGTLSLGTVVERTVGAGVTIDGALVKDGFAPFPTSFIQGFVPSHGADTDHDMAITAGLCRDLADGKNVISTITFTKRIDASIATGDGVGGLFTGTVAADTTYHGILIEKNSDGSIEWGYDTDPAGANKPSGFTARRRVFSILTDGSANIINGSWREIAGGGLENLLLTPILDVNVLDPGTAAVSRVISTPLNIQVLALITFSIDSNTSGGIQGLFTSLDQADTTPTATLYDLRLLTSLSRTGSVYKPTRTNTSSQVRTRQDSSGVGDTFRMLTNGFIDDRR